MSGISSSLFIINSALTTTQKGIEVGSANLANTLNPNHSRLKAEVAATVTGNTVQGVQIAGIGRLFDANLLRNVLNTNSQLGENKAVSDSLQQVQHFFGLFGEKDSTSHLLTDMFKELDKLAENPTSPQAATNAIRAAKQLAADINTFADGIQKLREEADHGIGDAVTSVNKLLLQLEDNSKKLAQAKGLGQATPSLEDQRDGLLKQLSEYLPVQALDKKLGGSYIQTPSGIPLVITKSRPLSFATSTQMGANLSYPTDLSGVLDVDGNDVTSKIRSGKLHGLFQLRDSVLPGIQEKLDELASNLRDAVNEIHNQGSSYKPQQTLTGQRAIPTGDATAFTGTGTIRIAVLNQSDNKIVTHEDIDLSTVTTMGDLRAAINAINTTVGTFDARLTASGTLEITTGDTNLGVAITSLGPATETTTGLGFSHFFGLNNFFTTGAQWAGGSRTGTANVFQVNPSLVADPAKIARAKLTTGAITNGTTEGLAAGDARNITDMVGLRTAQRAFNAAGDLSSITTTLEVYATSILGSESTNAAFAIESVNRVEAASQKAKEDLSQYSGVNMEQELMELQQNAMLHNAAAATFQIIREVSRDIVTLVG